MVNMFSKKIFQQGSTGQVLKLICITWIITKIICYKLWLADRLFPLIPVHDLLLILPSVLHAVLFIVSLGSMILLIIFPGKKTAIVLLVAEIISCLLDQNRWQPWEYQFVFMLAVYIINSEEKWVRYSWQLILAGIYFFSGIGKLNSAFIHDVWQNLVLHRWLGYRPENIWMIRAGYALPFIEIIAGAGLLFSNTRKLAVWVLTGMHILILLMLGPAGLHINAVIWPWNILMPLLLFSVFYNNPFSFRQGFVLKPVIFIAMVCWWILPWFQLAGYWDKYLSSVLYSGGVEQLFICTDNFTAKKEMSAYMDAAFKVIPCSPVLSVYKWGVEEMRTAPYPERRVYLAIIRSWKKKYPGKTDRFYLYKPGFSYQVEELIVR